MRWWWWIIIPLVAGIAGYFLVRELERLVREPSEIEQVERLDPGSALRTVQIFYGAHDRVGLASDDRAVVDPVNMEELAEVIAREVLNGPQKGIGGLSCDTEVKGFYVSEDGVGYLDLCSEVLVDWPQGDGLEWVSLGALVRSLTDNIPSLRAVQILVEGRVVEKSPGSIPLDLPLEPEWFGATHAEVIK